jgi:hypothetical protein
MRDKVFVHIIESPSDENMLDGLTEGRSLASALELAGIHHCYNLVTTEKSLQIALYGRLSEEIQKNGMLPILHFSMHGGTGGIQLTDNKIITWHELYQLIMPIQQLLQKYSLDLLICMSSCYGSFATQMAQIKEGDIPFQFLIGNRDRIHWSDAAVAYITFYHLLFKGFDPNYCYETMKLASGNDQFEIYNGQQVHFKWITHNQQFKQNLVREVARRLKQRQITY